MPAKMAGEVYKGEMLGSETSKRCRELRKAGILESFKEGKFEVFKFPLVEKKEAIAVDGKLFEYPPLAENHKRWTGL